MLEIISAKGAGNLSFWCGFYSFCQFFGEKHTLFFENITNQIICKKLSTNLLEIQIPWIGDNYESASCKILLVGESVYEGSVPWETKDFINSNSNYVRECNVLYWAKGEGGGNAVFPKNTKNILTLSNPSLSRDKFWNGVAFTEVIQEVISNSKEHS